MSLRSFASSGGSPGRRTPPSSAPSLDAQQFSPSRFPATAAQTGPKDPQSAHATSQPPPPAPPPPARRDPSLTSSASFGVLRPSSSRGLSGSVRAPLRRSGSARSSGRASGDEDAVDSSSRVSVERDGTAGLHGPGLASPLGDGPSGPKGEQSAEEIDDEEEEDEVEGESGAAFLSAGELGGKTVAQLERNLGKVAEASEKKEMDAFGAHKKQVLSEISQIRKQQVDIFRKQMILEFGLSMDETEEGNDREPNIFSSEGFSEMFQEKFKKKEKSLEAIHVALENLTSQLKQVNALSAEESMPRDPGFEGKERKGSADAPLRMTRSEFEEGRAGIELEMRDETWMRDVSLGER